jgi:hypothetical protein
MAEPYLDNDLYNYTYDAKKKQMSSWRIGFTIIKHIVFICLGLVVLYNFMQDPKVGWRPVLLYLIVAFIAYKIFNIDKKYLIFDKL